MSQSLRAQYAGQVLAAMLSSGQLKPQTGEKPDAFRARVCKDAHDWADSLVDEVAKRHAERGHPN